MKRVLTTFALTALLVTVAAGVRAADPAGPTIIPANSVKWVEGTGDMKGTWSAVLYGDPTQKGSQYALRIKCPDGLKLPAHYHNELELVTIISGTFLLGIGDKWDTTKMTTLGPGSFAALPANVHHYGVTKGETVLELHGIGPESMVMVKGMGGM